jgi:hypothetical protein
MKMRRSVPIYSSAAAGCAASARRSVAGLKRGLFTVLASVKGCLTGYVLPEQPGETEPERAGVAAAR